MGHCRYAVLQCNVFVKSSLAASAQLGGFSTKHVLVRGVRHAASEQLAFNERYRIKISQRIRLMDKAHLVAVRRKKPLLFSALLAEEAIR